MMCHAANVARGRFCRYPPPARPFLRGNELDDGGHMLKPIARSCSRPSSLMRAGVQAGVQIQSM